MLVGCVEATSSHHEFTIAADEIRAAWVKQLYSAMREAEIEGTEPFWLPMPSFSDARCRWTKPSHEALCRYAQSIRPSQQPRLTGKEAERSVLKTAEGWDFGF
jgi:uncharacterized membrane protein